MDTDEKETKLREAVEGILLKHSESLKFDF